MSVTVSGQPALDGTPHLSFGWSRSVSAWRENWRAHEWVSDTDWILSLSEQAASSHGPAAILRLRYTFLSKPPTHVIDTRYLFEVQT